MTTDHLRPLLESVEDTTRFWRFSQDLARAEVPEEIVDAIRLGRLTALQKPNGGVRGIVSGDVVRRLVARTIAQQLTPAVQRGHVPFAVCPFDEIWGRMHRSCTPDVDGSQ